jgi:hypothetical protein
MVLTDEYVAMLAVEGNGAVQAELPEGKPLFTVLAGPIKYWWGRMDTDEFKEYTTWREAVRVALIKQGHLVYSPHRAWNGAWHESAQLVNDMAIMQADALIVVTPEGIPAEGTDAEIEVAKAHNRPIIMAPPGGREAIQKLVDAIRDLHETTEEAAA